MVVDTVFIAKMRLFPRAEQNRKWELANFSHSSLSRQLLQFLRCIYGKLTQAHENKAGKTFALLRYRVVTHRLGRCLHFEL